MAIREGWTPRWNVSEKDPDYIKESKTWRDSHSSSIFGRGALFIYEGNTKFYEQAMQNSVLLEQEALRTDPESARLIRSHIEETNKSSNELLKNRSRYLKSDFQNLFQNYINLVERPGIEDRKSFVQNEIGNMFNDPEILEGVYLYLGPDKSKHTYENFLEKIKDDTIPGEFLYKLAKRHESRIETQEKELEEIVESTKQDFRRVISDAVKEGWLPEEAQESLKRIDSVKVVLMDRLENMHSSVMGDSADSGRIRVSNERLINKEIDLLKKTLFHEFLHELSGVSIVVATKIEEGRFPIHHLYERKSGVVVHEIDSFYTKNQWLNEAITEWLALKLAAKIGYVEDKDKEVYKGSLSYISERKELDRLFDAGLNEKTVVEAYFENFAEDRLKGNRGEKFAALVKEINTLEGVYGLAILQNKFEIEETIITLYNEGLLPWELSENLVNFKWPKDYKVSKITITVGSSTSGLGSYKKELVYVRGPLVMDDTVLSAQQQWDAIEKRVLGPMKRSGIVNYMVEDIKSVS